MVMNEIKIIRELLTAKGMSAKTLAEKMGYNTPSGVSNRLQSKTMTVEKLIEMLDAMDCELIIKNKVGDKSVYVVDNTERNDVKNYKKKDGADNE
jgi:transcriptional regulator with XRE-family HTH domain